MNSHNKSNNSYIDKKVIESSTHNEKIDKASQTLLTSQDFSNVKCPKTLMSNEEYINLFYSQGITQKEHQISKIQENTNKKRSNSSSCKNNLGFELFKKEYLNLYPKETDANILAQWELMDKETKSMYQNRNDRRKNKDN